MNKNDIFIWVVFVVAISLLFFVAYKHPEFQRYRAGVRAKIDSQQLEENMEIRKKYYEKLEIKRSIKPHLWTEDDEKELENLYKSSNFSRY
jgi:hypothetical protein